jgi:hypothetical protein
MVRPQVATRCECCGTAAKLAHVAVRHRKTGEPRTLRLCPRCVEHPDRTWRLVFEEDV